MSSTEKSEVVNYKEFPSVSVVIITKNNHELLKKAIASIDLVDYPASKMQVVVCEETNHPQPLESWVDYHTIPVRNRGFGYARNQALSYSRHAIVVFTDDDCTFEKSWLRELITPLIEFEKIAAVGGSVFVPSCGPVGKCENIIGFPGGGVKYYHQAAGKIVTRPTFSTCNCAIRKSVIDSIGGFNESMQYGGEDEQLSCVIGAGGIVYNPRAIVYHKPRDSLNAVFLWFVRRGFAEVHQARMRDQSSHSLLGFIKNAPLVRLSVIMVISLASGFGSCLLFPVLFFYYLALLWKFRWAYRYYPSVATLLMVPLVRTVMDVGRDVGIVRGLFLIKKR